MSAPQERRLDEAVREAHEDLRDMLPLPLDMDLMLDPNPAVEPRVGVVGDVAHREDAWHGGFQPFVDDDTAALLL